MNILLLGTDNFSAASLYFMLQHGYNICGVITHSKAKHTARLKNIAQNNYIPFYIVDNVNSDESYKLIQKIKPDIIFSIHFDRILQKKIINSALKCAVNLHPSLLPAYRGMSPFQSVLKNGELETGITIHYMTEDVDDGDIIEQLVVPLKKDTFLGDLYIIMMNLYPAVIERALTKIISDNFKAVKQDRCKSSYFGKIKEEDYYIQETDSCITVYNKIRAFSKPDKGARYGNFIIWHATIESNENNDKFYILEKDNGLYIFTKDGLLFSKKGSYQAVLYNNLLYSGGGDLFN